MKGRREHRGGARLREVRKRFARGARQRVQPVRVARFGVRHVIEERPELRVRQLRRDVGHFLDDRLALQRGGDDGADLAELFSIGGVFTGCGEETGSLRDIACDLGGADDFASVISDGRHRQRDR